MDNSLFMKYVIEIANLRRIARWLNDEKAFWAQKRRRKKISMLYK